MRQLQVEIDRVEHPLDVVERLASIREWMFDRTAADEMSVSVSGKWAEYRVAFTWIEDVEALHVACAFDLKVPDRRRQDILQLLSQINEQLWVGHFDLWNIENTVMFRHALLLAGGADPTAGQCETMLRVSVEACERLLPGLPVRPLGRQDASEALDFVLFETEGEA